MWFLTNNPKKKKNKNTKSYKVTIFEERYNHTKDKGQKKEKQVNGDIYRCYGVYIFCNVYFWWLISAVWVLDMFAVDTFGIRSWDHLCHLCDRGEEPAVGRVGGPLPTTCSVGKHPHVPALYCTCRRLLIWICFDVASLYY